MKLIWYYITYPIRLLLKNKVERYEEEIKTHESWCMNLKPKVRRSGMTETIIKFYFWRLASITKLKRFVNKWKLNK